MVIEFDPIFSLYTKESVLLALFGSTEEHLYKKELFLREIVEKYMDGDTEGIKILLNEKNDKYLKDAAREWRVRGYTETAAGRITRITDNYLDKNQKLLEYKGFPLKLYETAKYYRKFLPREILYLVTWKNESGVPEDEFIAGLKKALSINNRMNLDEITSFVMTRNAELEQKAAEHALALEVMQSIGIDRDSPAKADLQIVSEWIKNGWTREDVLLTCASATGNPTFRYIHAILLNIEKIREGTGLKTVREVFRLIQEYKDTTGASGKKQLHPSNTIRYYQLRNQYDGELIRMATETARNEFKPNIFNGDPLLYIERIILRWKKEGVDSAEKAKKYLQSREEEVTLLRKVFDLLGISRKTTETDYKTLRKWREMGFDEIMILRAAEDALEADKPMLYITKVLGIYNEKGIRTPEQADASKEAYIREKRAKKEKTVRTAPASAQYENQRDYSGEQEEAMNRMLSGLKNNE